LAGRHERLALDLGTGDGAAVIRRARHDAAALVIGVDPNAAAMRDASRLAARQPKKGGLPNALFVLAAAENLPSELDGRVDELWITLPWGSLLRGAVCAEPWLVDGMHRLLRPGAEVGMLLSVTQRDASMGLPVLDAGSIHALATTYRTFGFTPLDARAATLEDVRESGSSWARRLDIPRSRPAWRLRLRVLDQTAGTTGGGREVQAPHPAGDTPGDPTQGSPPPRQSRRIPVTAPSTTHPRG
jgi:16S rRNA (adenine(1408)-N(1))-methyltransferase